MFLPGGFSVGFFYFYGMNDFVSALLLLVVGAIAGFININAGGGSTLTLPTLIFLGLEGSLANGTNRVAILIQNIFALYKYHKESYSQIKLSLKFSLFTIPGVIIGAFAAVNISDETFQTLLAIIMIGVIISMIIPRKEIAFDNDAEKHINWKTYLALFGIGFYGGFVQVGVGFLLMATLYYLARFSLIYVNLHKVFIVFIYTIPALVIFILTDNVNWFYGLALAAGNSIGGWWAVKLQVKKGDKVIRIVLIVAVLIMALKLLKLF